ncbi:2-oxoadipate dioxygenase/decarboxylase HglS [Ruegeria atlantica]|uniref:2-oxoadipate dioxygenase/decarboxylase HglS n=1 Tax=Ruegeria atlantica TaxID=81569 RepID=UPI00147E169F|nr:VOC family protein [Ruegeria atlantica]
MAFISPDTIRKNFSIAMSDMFRQEVPAYGMLVDMVEQINSQTLADDAKLQVSLESTDGVERITEERHGAIRLGTEEELFNMRRLFAVMGMSPVSYYDLSVASIPVHATAFRPVERAALAVNPFRVFTSLLRLDLIKDEKLREDAKEILSTRQIFTARVLELIAQAERDGGLNEADSAEFVSEALETFRWHSKARLDQGLFERLLQAHRLIADVVSFNGPHINHLTPRTLDIDAVQVEMPNRGIDPKAIVEGPPARKCPVLLRQTSFKALNEPVFFKDGEDGWVAGHHTARFGEIEQRGAALTPKGRELYDTLLNDVRGQIRPDGNGSNSEEYMAVLTEVFAAFPDDWAEIRTQELAYFQYYLTEAGLVEIGNNAGRDLDALIADGLVGYAPVVYEDFLPVSAAGIFQSNLGDDQGEEFVFNPNQEMFEKALGAAVLNEFDHYATMEANSIEAILAQFNAVTAAE